MARLNVLITAASRRVALVQAFQRALRRPGISGKVLVTDVNPLSPAVHMADRAFRVPYADEPDYLDEIHAVCEANGVGLIIPTIDDELPLFAARRAVFEAAGMRVAIAGRAHRGDLQRQIRDLPRRCAPRASPPSRPGCPTTLPASPELPLFIKPRGGRGGVQAFPITNQDELRVLPALRQGSGACSAFCDGPEFTLDLLCDFKGKPLSVVPRERVVIRSGVIDRGVTSNDPALDPARARLRARSSTSPAPSTSSAASSMACRRCSKSTRGFRAASR